MEEVDELGYVGCIRFSFLPWITLVMFHFTLITN